MWIVRCILILILLIAAFLKKGDIYWFIPGFVIGNYFSKYVQHKKTNKTKRNTSEK